MRRSGIAGIAVTALVLGLTGGGAAAVANAAPAVLGAAAPVAVAPAAAPGRGAAPAAAAPAAAQAPGAAQAPAQAAPAQANPAAKAAAPAAAPAPARPAAPAKPAAPAAVPGVPCSAAARACIDLTHNKAWLLRGGVVEYGPVPITSGRKGWRTPVGTFRVLSKERLHLSRAFNNAPMPYSVFFIPGIAFHQGSLGVASHGCIHLSKAAAIRFYNTLRIGDVVQAVR